MRSRLWSYNSALAGLPIISGEAGLWRAGSPPNDAIFLTDESGNGVLVYPCSHPSDKCLPINEETQAQYIPKLFARARDFGVDGVFHFSLDEVDYDGIRGLVRADGGLTPGYYALRKAAAFFSSATPDAGLLGLLTVNSGQVESYGFVAGGSSVVAIWARPTLSPLVVDPTAVVSAPAGSTAVNKRGDNVASAGNDSAGRALFQLTSSPIYITLNTGTAPPTAVPTPAGTATPVPTPMPPPTVVPVQLSDSQLPPGIPPPNAVTGGGA